MLQAFTGTAADSSPAERSLIVGVSAFALVFSVALFCTLFTVGV